MKKNFIIFPVLFVCAAALVQAQSKPAAGRIATISIQQAITSTQDGKKAAADMAAKFGSRQQTLKKRQDDLEGMQGQMRSGGATMSAAAKDKLARDIDTSQKALTRDGEDFDAEVQQEQNKLMNDLGQKMLEVIGKYSGQNAISTVIDVSNPQAVLWADPSIDITNEIVKLYDQAHPAVSAPGAAAPKPPAPAPAPPKKQ